jgi:hypothetical protein
MCGTHRLLSSEFFVEAVAYQQAAIEELERRAFAVTAMHPIKDKRARLRVAAQPIFAPEYPYFGDARGSPH